MAQPISFVLVLERGPLEDQALLLVESIRAFAGPFRDAPVWAVQPRPGPRPARATLDRLASMEANFIRADLNQTWQRYAFANKAAAAAFVEGIVEGDASTLVFLDSDTVVLQPPVDLALDGGKLAAVRPVDRVLAGSPDSDPVSPFWDRIYRECGVDPSRIWLVTPTVERRPLRAYFQAGVIAVRPEVGLLRQWRSNLDRMARHRGDSGVFSNAMERMFVEQACLAATLLAETDEDRVRLLDRRFNYPLHKHARLPSSERIAGLGDAAVVHYHKAFYGRRWWRDIRVDEPLATWLSNRLPLPGLRARLEQSRPVRGAVARVRGLSKMAFALRARRL